MNVSRRTAVSVSRRKAISVGMLLAGYSALVAGLFSLASQPLLSVLVVLGGMALSLCSATELIQEPSNQDSASSHGS
jgi:hypothetical protein